MNETVVSEAREATPEPEQKAAGSSPVRRRRGRLVRTFRALGVGGTVGLALLVLMAIAAVAVQWVSPWGSQEITPAGPVAPESSSHFLGTDMYGRDLFTRVAYGARVSLIVGTGVSVMSMILGVALGLLAVSAGKLVDSAIGRVTDALLAIPSILFAITILAVLGPGLWKVTLALTIVYTPIMIRVTRGSALAVRERMHVRAARALGASQLRIARRHIAPFVVGPVVVQATFIFATAVLYEALLSFLGLGVAPPTPSFGNIVSESLAYIYANPRYVLYPSIFLTLTVFSVNLVGDRIRDILDPEGKSGDLQ